MKILQPNTIKFESMDEFKSEMSDFQVFVEKMERKHGFHKDGVFKIIPPSQWNPVKGGLTVQKIRKMKHLVEKPCYQKFTKVSEGIFDCFFDYDIDDQYTLGEFYALSEKNSSNPSQYKSHEDIEQYFWKNFMKDKPFYGLEVVKYIMDSSEFNFRKLRTILDIIKKKMEGINTSFGYVGWFMSIFGSHVEDKDLYGANILLIGSSKVWYVIRPSDGHRYEDLIKKLAGPNLEAYKNCSNFLRHKSCLVTPDFLKKNNIRFTKMVQNKNEIICVTPFAYHQGYNEGPNYAEAINFATNRWIEYGKRSNPCNPCGVYDNVKEVFKMDAFVKEFQSAETYQRWIKGIDVKPHPELPSHKKYEFMLAKFNEVAEQNQCLEITVKDQSKVIEEQEYQINKITLKDTPESSDRPEPVKRKKVTIKEPKSSEKQPKKPKLTLNVDKSDNELVAEKKTEKKAARKMHKCPQCTYTGRNDHLKAHMVTHESAKSFHCEQCDYSGKFKQNLQKHVKAVHGREKPFKCKVDKCSYETAYQCDLTKHNRIHHE